MIYLDFPLSSLGSLLLVASIIFKKETYYNPKSIDHKATMFCSLVWR